MPAEGEVSAGNNDDWGDSLSSVFIGNFGEELCLIDP